MLAHVNESVSRLEATLEAVVSKKMTELRANEAKLKDPTCIDALWPQVTQMLFDITNTMGKHYSDHPMFVLMRLQTSIVRALEYVSSYRVNSYCVNSISPDDRSNVTPLSQSYYEKRLTTLRTDFEREAKAWPDFSDKLFRQLVVVGKEQHPRIKNIGQLKLLAYAEPKKYQQILTAIPYVCDMTRVYRWLLRNHLAGEENMAFMLNNAHLCATIYPRLPQRKVDYEAMGYEVAERYSKDSNAIFQSTVRAAQSTSGPLLADTKLSSPMVAGSIGSPSPAAPSSGMTAIASSASMAVKLVNIGSFSERLKGVVMPGIELGPARPAGPVAAIAC